MGDGPEVTGGTGGRRRALVDGMNLIGSRPDRWWNDRDGAVHRLVRELDRFAAATGEDVTVVFDRRPPDLEPGRHGSVEVAFASWRGRDAADHGYEVVVVTDATATISEEFQRAALDYALTTVATRATAAEVTAALS